MDFALQYLSMGMQNQLEAGLMQARGSSTAGKLFWLSSKASQTDAIDTRPKFIETGRQVYFSSLLYSSDIQ